MQAVVVAVPELIFPQAPTGDLCARAVKLGRDRRSAHAAFGATDGHVP
jgi:hypothetical protein